MAASIIRDDRTVLVRSPVNWDLIGNKLEFHPEEAGYEVITVTSQALVKTDQGRRAVYSQRLDGFPLYVLLADSEIRVTQDWLREVAVPGSLFLLLIAAFVTLNVKLIALNRQNADIQAKLEVAARYDLLTGLRNRPYFYERTQEEMSRSTRTNQSIVMLGADIDHFKAVNDTYGHQAGDEILKRIAAVIDQNIRTVDVSGRIGGEEFSVLLTNANLAAGREIAERIRRETESISFGEWKGGISIGVAQWWGERESIERLFARADEALYRAKNAGRNRVEVDWRTSEGSETLSG
jgi:diguanylate cyclase (GGDEF)-like protein